MTVIPYGRQDISPSDVDAVARVLRSDFLTQGPEVPAFEKAVSGYCEAEYAVAVNSATSALHIACLALGVGHGDWVWTSPITFVASANCALYCGAGIDFVDIDPVTYNMSVDRLSEKLAQAEEDGTLPKVVIPVHLAGQSCDMEGIFTLAQRYGFRIVEDASHAIGGKYLGEPIGSGRYSDITVFSFHPVKIITTAEGGMAVTNNPELAQRMLLLRSHGITRDPGLMTHTPDGPWYYQQIELGFNYRMTELQGALGISQLQRLDTFVARRNQLAEQYRDLLKGAPLTVQCNSNNSYSAYHLYIVRLCLDEVAATHRQVFEALLQRGIGVNVHYIPVHLQPYFQQRGFKHGDYPVAERYYEEAISIPMFAALTDVEQGVVVSALRDVLCGVGL
ncbi:UDP-4-amino-4,6-dideoxy-N-acetyl-beta-L-altrosamine transaminase [Accumulibacter sp.]|uniref:UDP-4-amino-4, 6-dideoxy-N-acetyl-beta-L-altrosamine transaminase n=1 Tax=Accumulibacter sp. TaxID=2053492 RepID=UPI00261C946C|nr:UDP-4-amino-4,6-dideoxy-N-acetyl-beta-L-altrosamine transaminase [Accumulibacter sp.]